MEKQKTKRTFPNLIEGVKNAFKIEELRNRLIFTFLILLVYRIGCNLPVPFVDASMLESLFSGESVFAYLNTVGGGALASCSFFALGVSAYINASIIMQLLCVAIPSLEMLQKEGGQEGRDKINKIQKCMSIAFALIMSAGYYLILKRSDALKYTKGFSAYFSAAVIIALLVAGSQIVVWLGEQIDSNGIGNGISMIIFVGIVSGWSGFYRTIQTINFLAKSVNKLWYLAYVVISVVILSLLLFIIYMDAAERRIPIQYASRSGASRRMGGGSSILPIRVMMTGVMPVIFASSICSVPSTIAMFVDSNSKLYEVLSSFNSMSWQYCVILAVLIVAFNIFYVAVQYDPLQISNDLRKNGGVIAGFRPGQATTEYLRSQFKKISRIGAISLIFIALTPIILGNVSGIPIQFGGTSFMIMVSVAVEAVKSIESITAARHHKGFLG